MSAWCRKLFVVALLCAATGRVGRAVEPLPEDQRAIFLGSAEDPPAKALDGVSGQEGRHYVTGNEWNLQLFKPALEGLGGGYVGVGSDQAYLFIGWQRPELAWLIDYDPLVVDIHRIYHAFFAAAESPAAFRAFWDRAEQDQAEAAIAARYPGNVRTVARLSQLLRVHRAKIAKRLDKVRDSAAAAKVPTFLDDQATYGWIRAFILAGRARPMVADLLGRKGLRGIGKAAAALGVPIRVFYVSNAEQYWAYNANFRKNVAGVVHDERSLLLRTLLTWDRNHDYRYVIQPVGNFKRWLDKTWVVGLYSMIHIRKDEGSEPEFLAFELDPDAEEARLRHKGLLP